jgi:AraC-like DNA-binding protein
VRRGRRWRLHICARRPPGTCRSRNRAPASLLLLAAKAESFSLPKPKSERACKLAEHITRRLDDNRSLEIIADEVGGASLRTFERLFVEETGLSLAAWRRQSRMLAAISLLSEGQSISEVATAVGYDSAAAFSTAFKQCFGVPPSGYLET